jgi:hypothetical protein
VEPPHRALTRDISNTGIRFLGTRSLLGQRLKVEIGAPDESAVSFTVRIVWTCEVGDQLYENGGVFLEKLP